jgi:hypothetical protein
VLSAVSRQRQAGSLRSENPLASTFLIPALPLSAQFIQDRLNGWIGSQHGGSHHFPELAPRLPQLVMRGSHRGISHRFLMRGSQLRALFLAQIRPARAAFIPKGPIRRLLCENGRRKLECASERGKEEEGQFRFHLFVIKPGSN